MRSSERANVLWVAEALSRVTWHVTDGGIRFVAAMAAITIQLFAFGQITRLLRQRYGGGRSTSPGRPSAVRRSRRGELA